MFIIFGGLPGAGKTTIAKEVAKHLKAVYLRVDTIEQALKNSGYFAQELIGPEGYLIGYAIAKENLDLGLSVVVDSVNPIAITRHAWQEVAQSTRVIFLEVEIICSDLNEHKKRIETRTPDIVGHKLPSWEEVKARDYEPWKTASLIVDTANYSIDEAVKRVLVHISNTTSC